MRVGETIQRYIVEEIAIDMSGSELTCDYPLLETGVVDSMDILNLVLWIESMFNIEIDEDDLVGENFASIDDIARLVESKV